MKIKKIIGSSLATIALAASLASGATYALFTSEDAVNIAISAGKVKVNANIENLQAYSGKWDGAAYINEDAAGSGNDFTFHNGGKAILSGATLTLSEITPMDGVKFDIKIQNESNVKIMYRTVIASTGGEELFKALNVTINGVPFDGDLRVSNWQTVALGGDALNKVEIFFPNSADNNNFQSLDTSMVFAVEAVQENGIHGFDSQYLADVSTQEELVAALNGPYKVIKLNNDIKVIGQTIHVPAGKTIVGGGYKLDLTGSVAPQPKKLARANSQASESELVLSGEGISITDLIILVGSKPVVIGESSVALVKVKIEGNDKTATAIVVNNAVVIFSEVEIDIPSNLVPQEVKVLVVNGGEVSGDMEIPLADALDIENVDEFVSQASALFSALNEVNSGVENATKEDLIAAYETLQDINLNDVSAVLESIVGTVVESAINTLNEEIVKKASETSVDTIVIELYDGDMWLQTNTVIKGATFKATNISKSGYELVGWNLAGSSDVFVSLDTSTYEEGEPLELYANWIRVEIVTNETELQAAIANTDVKKVIVNAEIALENVLTINRSVVVTGTARGLITDLGATDKYDRALINITSDNVELSNLKFYYLVKKAITVSGSTQQPINGFKFVNNTLNKPGKYGLELTNLNGAYIANNLFNNANPELRINKGALDSCAIDVNGTFSLTNDLVIENNTIVNGKSENGMIRFNGNETPGSAEIIGNTFKEIGTNQLGSWSSKIKGAVICVYEGNQGDILIQGNIFDNCSIGISAYKYNGGAGRDDEFVIDNNSFINNATSYYDVVVDGVGSGHNMTKDSFDIASKIVITNCSGLIRFSIFTAFSGVTCSDGATFTLDGFSFTYKDVKDKLGKDTAQDVTKTIDEWKAVMSAPSAPVE